DVYAPLNKWTVEDWYYLYPAIYNSMDEEQGNDFINLLLELEKTPLRVSNYIHFHLPEVEMIKGYNAWTSSVNNVGWYDENTGFAITYIRLLQIIMKIEDIPGKY